MRGANTKRAARNLRSPGQGETSSQRGALTLFYQIEVREVITKLVILFLGRVNVATIAAWRGSVKRLEVHLPRLHFRIHLRQSQPF